VSVDPKIQPRPTCPAHHHCHRRTLMNHYVVAVDANSGLDLQGTGGYDPKLKRR
jgi:hypothetical protein